MPICISNQEVKCCHVHHVQKISTLIVGRVFSEMKKKKDTEINIKKEKEQKSLNKENQNLIKTQKAQNL